MTETPFCRCCLTQECDKNMCIEYLNGKSKEIYAEMLFNTFHIIISNPGCNPSLICDNCIAKLRDATEFKQQVLNAQSTFNDKLNSKMDSQLKIEVDEDDFNDFDDEVSEHFSESDFMWGDRREAQKGQVLVIKLEPKDDELNNVVPNNAEEVPNLLNIRTQRKIQLKTNEVQKSINKKVKTVKKIRQIGKAKPRRLDSRFATPPITQREINARENTLKLIENSNLCLFRSLRTKFGCFMCRMTFVEPSKLREHSTSHTNNTLLAYRVNRWRGISYKNADISDLKCNKCLQQITDLTHLMTHLTDKHNITFRSVDNFLIPYKLTDNNQCALCELKFNTFLRLAMHMNSHYKYNVCEICGLSFINRTSLRMHVQSMHREKKCSHCPAKFLTDASKLAHLKKVHNVFSSTKRYCNLCDKTFSCTYLLVKHKFEEHEAKKPVLNCSDCDKTFNHETNLKLHIRCVHIRERNHPCDVCGSRFFTRSDLKRHENTHNDVRSFSCTYCD